MPSTIRGGVREILYTIIQKFKEKQEERKALLMQKINCLVTVTKFIENLDVHVDKSVLENVKQLKEVEETELACQTQTKYLEEVSSMTDISVSSLKRISNEGKLNNGVFVEEAMAEISVILVNGCCQWGPVCSRLQEPVFHGDLPSRWRVRLGSSLAGSGGAEHAVSQLVLHPQYDGSTLDSDIAVVRLARAAVFEVSVGVASIAGPDYSLADGTQVTAIGWGTLTPRSESPQQLQHVVIAIISHAYCKERYAWLKTQAGFENWPDVTDNMVCAGLRRGGGDACPGTAGDPLVHHRNVLVGVTSWGNGCAEIDFPSVSARVSRYTDWITSTA